jgi:16S rRNA processing protein RimM
VRVRQTPKGFLVDLEGVESREEAGALRGAELLLDRSELDGLEEEEYYFDDLVGLEAVDERGEVLGQVTEVLENPAHETLVVENEGGEISMIPFVAEQVPGVDLARGRVLVRPLPE